MSRTAEAPADSLSVGGRRGGVLIAATAAASAVFGLVSQVLYERAFGVVGFGQWAYITSVLSIVVPLACMGSGHLLLSKALAPDLGGRRGLQLALLYFGAFALAALVVLVTVLVHGAATAGSTNWAALVLLFACQIPITLVFPVFQLQGRTGWVAGWPALQVGLRFVVALAALWLGLGINGALWVWVIGSLGLTAFVVWTLWPVARRRFAAAPAPTPADEPRHDSTRRVFGAGVAFGFTDWLDSLDIKLLVPAATFLFGSVEAATAGLLMVVLSAIHFFPYVFGTRVLLPAAHRASTTDARPLRSLVVRMCATATILLLPAALAFSWIGFPMLSLVVRGDYSSQVGAIAWFGLAWIPLCVSQLAAVPFMGREGTGRLFRWRLEALAVFALASFAFSGTGLFGLIAGFSLGRSWLGLRLMVPLLSRHGPWSRT